MPQYIGYMPTGTANSSVTASSLTDIYTSLYLNMDGANNSTTFTDLSPNALTITPNDNSHISTVQSKFGGASVFLDGTGDHLRIPSNIAPLVLTGDFTIECFCRTTTTAGGDRALVVLNFGDSYAAQSIWQIGGTSLRLYSSSGGSWNISNGQTIGTLTADVWHHVAVTRSGNIYNLYLDGVRNTTFSSSLTPKSTGTYSAVGSLVSPAGYDWTGYVDDLRITKGIALYTGATLTVPTSAVTKNINALVVDRKYNSGIWSMNSIFTKILASNWPISNRGLVTVKMWGAGGAGGHHSGGNCAAGGGAAFVTANFILPVGTIIATMVGSAATASLSGGSSPGSPGGGQGFNTSSDHRGGSGGGYSAIYLETATLDNLLALAAAGGGGASYNTNGGGGGGGGLTGLPGNNSSGLGAGGGGGTQVAGGAANSRTWTGTSGSSLQGGAGSIGGGRTGGGGGAGYYGGGGGSAAVDAGQADGGGGGSSYVATGNAAYVSHSFADGTTGTNGGTVRAAPGGTADGNYPGSLVGYGGAKSEASYPGAIVILIEGSVVYTQTATGAGSYEVGT